MKRYLFSYVCFVLLVCILFASAHANEATVKLGKKQYVVSKYALPDVDDKKDEDNLNLKVTDKNESNEPRYTEVKNADKNIYKARGYIKKGDKFREEKDDFISALEQYKLAELFSPDDYKLHYRIGGIYWKLGNKVKALTHLDKCKDLYPKGKAGITQIDEYIIKLERGLSKEEMAKRQVAKSGGKSSYKSVIKVMGNETTEDSKHTKQTNQAKQLAEFSRITNLMYRSDSQKCLEGIMEMKRFGRNGKTEAEWALMSFHKLKQTFRNQGIKMGNNINPGWELCDALLNRALDEYEYGYKP